jgi:hypothetical protein
VARATLAQKMWWPDHPIFCQGVADHPIPAVWGWLRPPPGLWGWSDHPERPKTKNKKMGLGCWGWSGHPQQPKPIFSPFFFFLGGLSGWSDHPQRPGVAEATPRFPPFFSFFNFLLFFLKKKNLKLKMPKTTPFWAKRRHFGRVQNGLVLE